MEDVLFYALGLPCLLGFVIAIVSLLLIHSNRKGKSMNREESEIVQELHRSIEFLGKRIESLETIILESENAEEEK